MADVQLRSVIRQLRCVIGSRGGLRSPSDAQLVEEFIRYGDEAAVEMLIWRHGTMVLNLCRRILKNEHHAEDAFQAAFLVFARNAGSIGKRQSVGSWLYRVAYRVAHRLRAKLAKQPEQLTEIDNLDGLPGREPTNDLIWRDLRPVLDEEIDRLPEKYRRAIVLCYLQGHTTEETAELLRCPKKTIQTRLSRAREQLRSQLTRRGLALSTGWLATHLSVNASSVGVSAVLVDATVKAALAFPAGKAAVGLVSSSVVVLTQGVLHAMFITKMKIAAAIVFAVAALGMGTWSVAQRVARADVHRNREAAQEVARVPASHVPFRQKKGRKDPPKSFTSPVPQQEKPASPLPPDIVAAWEKAGARTGWMEPYGGWFRLGGEAKAGEVPAFQFKEWQGGVVDRGQKEGHFRGLPAVQLRLHGGVIERTVTC